MCGGIGLGATPRRHPRTAIPRYGNKRGVLPTNARVAGGSAAAPPRRWRTRRTEWRENSPGGQLFVRLVTTAPAEAARKTGIGPQKSTPSGGGAPGGDARAPRATCRRPRPPSRRTTGPCGHPQPRHTARPAAGAGPAGTRRRCLSTRARYVRRAGAGRGGRGDRGRIPKKRRWISSYGHDRRAALRHNGPASASRLPGVLAALRRPPSPAGTRPDGHEPGPPPPSAPLRFSVKTTRTPADQQGRPADRGRPPPTTATGGHPTRWARARPSTALGAAFPVKTTHRPADQQGRPAVPTRRPRRPPPPASTRPDGRGPGHPPTPPGGGRPCRVSVTENGERIACPTSGKSCCHGLPYGSAPAYTGRCPEDD
ncbi:hypothetical protein EKD16_23875 [Streptomonospora litoralis]|uniref:Uncharacterized protein n=1 Tax=Streptomonospora litoralis TaxID=2498135 RepID=A0A4P6QA08_9ACTN|nr:hypothetical protein EKD16_23875 [Streptomonospora litoralis]